MYELPLFPLNTVLFPGMPLRLQIFEERYRVMLKHVLQTNQTFGVNLIKNGMEALGPLPQPFEIGCTARVIQVDPQENGIIDLTVVGDERFHILRLGVPQDYLTAFVESAPLITHHTLEVVRGAQKLRRNLLAYLHLLAKYNADNLEGSIIDLNMDISNLQMPEDPMMLIYLSAALLQIPAREKQPLLEAETGSLLLERVQRLYKRELAVLPPLLTFSEEQARLAAWMN